MTKVAGSRYIGNVRVASSRSYTGNVRVANSSSSFTGNKKRLKVTATQVMSGLLAAKASQVMKKVASSSYTGNNMVASSCYRCNAAQVMC